MIMDDWLTESLDRLTGLLKDNTPGSRPSHHSKPWWTPHLTILRHEYHKAARLAPKQGTSALRETAKVSRSGYFKASKVAKNKHWSSFLLLASPQNLWMAKRFASGRAPPRFPSLPGAETPQQMNETLLSHFVTAKEGVPPPQGKATKLAPPSHKRRDGSCALQVLLLVGPQP